MTTKSVWRDSELSCARNSILCYSSLKEAQFVSATSYPIFRVIWLFNYEEARERVSAADIYIATPKKSTFVS